MDFAFSEEQQRIREAIGRLCAGFGDDYWLERDKEGGKAFKLTPKAYRKRRYPKWPGALLVTVWWVAVTNALPPVLRSFFSYDLTYGSLAGIMIALFFFWLVGLGMVVGAELNAALAETPEERDMIGQSDERTRRAAESA